MVRRRLGGGPSAYLFLVPAFALYAAFVLYPLMQTVRLSFTDWDGLTPDRSDVGTDNYSKALSDTRLYEAALNNVRWVLGSLIPQALGLVLAAVLSSHWIRGRTFFRTVFFMPAVFSLVVVGVMWDAIYNPLWGALNALLELASLDSLTRPWLADTSTAIWSVITSANWAYYGFAMVIYLAGIQAIDESLYEAAALDGAGPIQQFWYVTVPGVRQQITLLLIVSFINTLRTFELPYVMTNGGPGRATEVIGLYIFQLVQVRNQVGYGSAVAVLLTISVLLVSVIFLRIRESD